jgi:ubiquitin conjugation factor E4 B
VGGLEALVKVKGVPAVIVGMEEWAPDVSAERFEKESSMGPLCRLGVFVREWVCFFLLGPILT